jgi:hypothetical protein
MTSALTNFARINKKKDKMIEQALSMLREHGDRDASTILCLVNPEPNGEHVIDWSIVAHSVPSDEQEAVVTRRVLSGFLPIGCLQCAPSWRFLLDTKFVPPEYLDLYTAFAQSEAALIVRTLEGTVHPDDGWMTATTWEDKSYPGQPPKPREPGAIRVEVNLISRSVRVTVEPLNCYMDFPVCDDLIEGTNDEEDANYVARHAILAFEQISPPKGAMPGDWFDTYLMVPEGAPILLARTPASPSCAGSQSGYTTMGSA